MSISYNILKKYKNKFFVETGLGKGGGVRVSIDAGFDYVYSIEKYVSKYKKFGIPLMKKNPEKVEILLGDSKQLLWEIIKNINSPITFWLDAHDKPDKDKEGPPLLEELDIIANHPLKNHIILIDDIRLMGKYKFPSLSDIINKINKINSNYYVLYEDGGDSKQKTFIRDILVAQERVK